MYRGNRNSSSLVVVIIIGGGLVLALLLTLANGLLAKPAGVWYVDASAGSDSNNCLSPGAACLTIAGAVGKAANDDTIQIAAGVYAENDISISKRLTLVGAGVGSAIVDGSGGGRIFKTSMESTLSGMTIQNGNVTAVSSYLFDTSGGAIQNLAKLTIQDSLIISSTAIGSGGGIFNNGTLILDNTNVLNNSANDFGGGIYNYNLGVITITNSTVGGNTAVNNYGGGIYTNQPLYLTNVTMRDNSAGSFGGGLFLGDTSVLAGVTLSGNQAGNGAAIFAQIGAITLTNSTVSGNTASNNYGGIYISGPNTSVNLVNSTIANNTRTNSVGTGFNGLIIGNNATATFLNTIIAFNSGQNCGGTTGNWNSAGYNLSNDFTCAFSQVGDKEGTDPMLGPLADNGGDTLTHALQPGSPAIDAGTNSGCPATDQRGKARPYDGDNDSAATCDIGAVEAQPPQNRASVRVDLRDYGTDPETTIALVGQPMVWTNNGAKNHTITEGDPIFRLFLPSVLGGTGAGAAQAVSAASPAMEDTPIFDSGTIVPGGQFTYTFTTPGTYAYYSKYAPGAVTGKIVVVEITEAKGTQIDADSGGSVSTTDGADVTIAPGGLYTDTELTISVLASLPMTSSWGTSVSAAYEVAIGDRDVISKPITVTLPYDPGSLPIGTSETDIYAAYHNGLSWIMVPGIVDAENNQVVFETNHLSLWWLIIPSCGELRGEDVFTEDQKNAYEAGREFLKRISVHKDLIEAYQAGLQPMLSVDHDGAAWLAKKDICSLKRTSAQDINAKFPSANVTDWTEMAQAVIDIGEALNSQGYDEIVFNEMLERISQASTSVSFGLELVKWTLGSEVAITELLFKELVLNLAVKPLAYDIQLMFHYTDLRNDIQKWLLWNGFGDTTTKGVSNLSSSSQLSSGNCSLQYGASKEFFQTTIPGAGNSESELFFNLYLKNEGISYPGFPGAFATGFVLGLQDVAGLKYTFPFFDRIDGMVVVIEYTDTNGDRRVSPMWIRVPNLYPCVAGITTLPDIGDGSDIQATYYFIENSILVKHLGNNGILPVFTNGDYLCNGPCTDPNNPPNAPSNPTPSNGATNQSVNSVLNWTGGDPDGDAVTYDVYLEAGNPTPGALVSNDQSGQTYDPGTLSAATQYYWQIVAQDEVGAVTAGPVWNFTTATGPPTSAITLTLNYPQVSSLTVTVSGTVTATNSTITRINWQWGDGGSGDQWFPAGHTYAISGTYPITATAYDNLGNTAVQTTTAYVGLNTGEMVLVPAGEFQMGCDSSNPSENCYSNEQPLHTVYLDAYMIDKYEVTNDRYAAFLNTRNSNDCGGYECVDLDDPDTHITYQSGQYVVESGYGDHPVIEVTWYGADAYCTASGGWLPTEAEWEKAARGSSDTRMYPWGNAPADCTLANFYDNGYCVGDTTPVGSYPTGASPYGALDMAGNVWEWTNDWYSGSYYSSSPYSNPPGPASGTYKVVRGGGWPSHWSPLRAAYRYVGSPTYSYSAVGFRCASAPGG